MMIDPNNPPTERSPASPPPAISPKDLLPTTGDGEEKKEADEEEEEEVRVTSPSYTKKRVLTTGRRTEGASAASAASASAVPAGAVSVSASATATATATARNSPPPPPGPSTAPTSITSTSTAPAPIPAKKRRSHKRRPLHVEALLSPSTLVPIPTLSIEIQRFVVGIGRAQMVYKAGPVNLTGASKVIRESCLEVTVVDWDDWETSSEGGVEDANHKTGSSANPANSAGIGGGGGGRPPTIAAWLISTVQVHPYVLSTDEACAEELDNASNDEDLTACTILPLPHASLHQLWDSLILPPGTKSNLIEYATSALLFTDLGIDTNLISWNRVVLLHGPPGTGKTSLCRALAHKLSIRLGSGRGGSAGGRFTNGGYLVEVHSHSLFSKWFSESGKLVARLFDRITEMVEDDPDALCCVLVDEVESLAAARGSGGGGGGGTEPSDAVRAVNSLLTSIDRLRRYRNVVVLTTTNITGCVDVAFVDRADVKQFIGLPILEARYEILRSCVLELVRVGIIGVEATTVGVAAGEEDGKGDGDGAMVVADASAFRCDGKENRDGTEASERVGRTVLLPYRDVRRLLPTETASASAAAAASPSPPPQPPLMTACLSLLRCAEISDGLSGRSLRKLPFQSHALFVRSSGPVTLDEFLVALRGGIEREQEARRTMKGGQG